MASDKRQPRHPQTSRPGAPIPRAKVRPAAALPKVLRIGVIQSGKIIEERIVRRRETVTIGPSEKNHFVLTAPELGVSRFEMFETKGEGYTLVINEKMGGRASVKGQMIDLAQARAEGKLSARGRLFQLGLDEQARGKVTVGDTTILFQFVAPPPIQPRPQLPAAVRGGVFRSMDWFIASLWGLSLLLHVGVFIWLDATDWPKVEQWDRFMQLQELIAAQTDATFEKKKPEIDEGEGDEFEDEDEGDEQDEQPQQKTAKADTGPAKSAEELAREARERAERRAELAAKAAEQGILKILGTMGGDEAGGSIIDVLRDGDVGGDQAKLLAQVSGVGVATSDQAGTLRGPAGGKGSGEAADIDQVRVSGADKTVKTAGPGAERAVKGAVKRGRVSATGGAGMMDTGEVAKYVQQRLGAIRGCYEQALKRDPSLSGRVTIEFTIAGTGRVSSARATQNELGPQVESCMVAAFMRFRFPPPDGGAVTLAYPFLFNPAN